MNKHALTLALLLAGCAADTSDPAPSKPLGGASDPFSCMKPYEGVSLCSPAETYGTDVLFCVRSYTTAQYACVVDPRAPDGTWYSYTANSDAEERWLDGTRVPVTVYVTGVFQEHDCAEDRPLLMPGWCP